MNAILIQKLKDKKEIPWNLLLLGDPSKENVEKYMQESDMYVGLKNNEIVGVFVLTYPSPGIVELKNLAVDEKYQNQGIGKLLVLNAINRAKNKGARKIEVGTGNSSLLPLALYQKCGFRIVNIEKDFFTKNYKEKIIENGIKCVDMIQLEIQF